jgi:hypothetical protein
MFFRIATALSLLSLAAAAYADSENVRKWRDQLNFQPVASGNKGAGKGGASSGGASGGSSAPRASEEKQEKQERFRQLDIDGDGLVSKAEAAGNAPATLGFDRADRNRDGKLSFAEYDSIGKPRPARKKAQKAARGQGAASAGASRKAN